MNGPTHAEVTHILDLTCAIQQIPAPTFHEQQRAAFALDVFQRSNLAEVRKDVAGNVIGRLPGSANAGALVLSAHMDTVFPESVPLTLKRTEKAIHAPGIGDNSLGLATLLSIPALLEARHIRPAGDLILAATVCEEGLGNLRGIQAVTDSVGRNATYISLEGMGLGNVLHKGLGVERYLLSITTGGGHSWVDYGAASAVHTLVEIAHQLLRLRVPKRPRTSFNIGTIQGGTSVNTIAASARCEIDFRSEHPNALKHLVEKASHIINTTLSNRTNVTFERIGWRPAGEVSIHHPAVVLATSILTSLGVQTRLDTASTEANYPLSLGYPALTLGLTTGDRAHTTDEYICIEPFYQGLQQVIDYIALFWKQ